MAARLLGRRGASRERLVSGLGFQEQAGDPPAVDRELGFGISAPALPLRQVAGLKSLALNGRIRVDLCLPVQPSRSSLAEQGS